jgi:transcriptional regulator with XRE-family HTH domain
MSAHDTANAVRVAIAAKEWTASQAAAAAGITPSTLSRRLNRETPFTIPELFALADALDVPVADLIGRAA